MNSKFKVLLIFLLFFGAFAVRMYKIELMEFKYDEAFIFEQAHNIKNGLDYPLKGIKSSKEISNSPLVSYLLSIPLFIEDSPEMCVLFVVLLNAVSIIILYFALKNSYDNFYINFVCCLFIAFLPAHIAFSRKIWLQSNLSFFVSLFIFFMIKAFKEKKALYIFMVPLIYSALIQVHLSAAFIFPVFLFFLFKLRSIFKIIAAIIIFFAGLTLFIFILENEKLILLDFLINTETNIRPSFTIYLNHLLDLIKSYDYSFNSSIIFSDYLMIITSCFILIFSGIAFLYSILNFKTNESKIVIFFAAGIILYYVFKINSFHHYYIIYIPVVALMLQKMLIFFDKTKYKFTLHFICAFIILYSIFNIKSIYKFNQSLEKSGGSEDYGICYKFKKDAVKEIISKYKKNGIQFYISDGINYHSTLAYEFHTLFSLYKYNFKISYDSPGADNSSLIISPISTKNPIFPLICEIGKILYSNAGYHIIYINNIIPLPNDRIRKIYSTLNNISNINIIYSMVKQQEAICRIRKLSAQAAYYSKLARQIKPF